MKTKLLLILLLAGIATFAQKPVNQYSDNELFKKNGEIYFVLNNARSQADKLSRIISIDNIIGDDVYAYASKKEFTSLREKYDFAMQVLPAPSSIEKVDITDSPKQVLEWNYYPTYGAYVQIMHDFAASYPDICKIDTIGLSTQGRLIIAARISDNVGEEENEPEFLYTATMHGDETAGYILTLHLIDYLLTNYNVDSRITNMVNSMDIWINPLANPDGTYAAGNNTVSGATRYNANYVDLNRNFPDPDDGPHPDGNVWQPETVAFMNFAEERSFVLSANFHGGAEVVNYPWDTWSKLTADDAWWRMVSRNYADTAQMHSPNGYMNDLNNGITNGYAWYTITGGRQDYINYFHQCREFTLEVSNSKLLNSSQLLNNWNYNYRSMLNYMEESLYGIRGIVSDTVTGQPLKAQVFISGFDKDSSMVFSSMPIGNYHRLIKAGTYNLTFTANGYIPKTVRNVVVTDKAVVNLDVKLWNGSPVPTFTSSDTLIAPQGTIQFFDVSGGSPTSRLWTFEGGIPATSTEMNPVIKYPNTGSYSVTLKVTNLIGNNEITKNDYIKVEEGVGVVNINKAPTKVYPNPVNTGFIIAESANNIESVEIIDQTGKIRSEIKVNAKQAVIDLSGYTKGVYVLRIYYPDSTEAVKVINQ